MTSSPISRLIAVVRNALRMRWSPLRDEPNTNTLEQIMANKVAPRTWRHRRPFVLIETIQTPSNPPKHTTAVVKPMNTEETSTVDVANFCLTGEILKEALSMFQIVA